MTCLIPDAGARDNRAALNQMVALVASGRVPRESGGDPNAGLNPALAHGEFDAARALLACGADLELSAAVALDLAAKVPDLLHAATQAQVQFALALAALHGRTNMVGRLLDAGADPDRYNPEGVHSHCAPQHSAALAGHVDAVKALIAEGAKRDIADIHHDATPAQWARHAGHTDIASFLDPR